MDTKACSMCLINKPTTCYVKDKSVKCGLRANCKECDKIRKLKHYQENKEKYKQAYDEFILRNPDYVKTYKLK
jgi:hypothetical protein